MTDHSTIQQARDVLARYRKASRSAGPQNRFWLTADVDPAVKNLFILTTDTAMLDAIDGLLAQGQRRRTRMHDNMSHDLSHHAERIAAAIIAADEQMQH